MGSVTRRAPCSGASRSAPVLRRVLGSEPALRVAPGSRSRGRRRTGGRRRSLSPLSSLSSVVVPPRPSSRELDQPGVRRRVHRSERVVRLDRMDRGRGAQSLGDVRLKGVAVADGRFHPTDRLGVPFSTHVALSKVAVDASGSGRGRHPGHPIRSGQSGRPPATPLVEQRVERVAVADRIVEPPGNARTGGHARGGGGRVARVGRARGNRTLPRRHAVEDADLEPREAPVVDRPEPVGADSGNDSSSRAASYESQPNAPQGTARRSRREPVPRRRLPLQRREAGTRASVVAGRPATLRRDHRVPGDGEPLDRVDAEVSPAGLAAGGLVEEPAGPSRARR